MNSSEPLTLPESNIHSFRLHRHYLIDRASKGSVENVVKNIGGLQAQLDSAARIALWARVQDLKPEEIDKALWDNHTLVKTWSMRGTLHFLAASDFPLYVSAMRNSGLKTARQWLIRHGIKTENFESISKSIVEVLASGPMTKKELCVCIVDRLGSNVKPMIERVWGDLIKIPAMEGSICFGSQRDKEVTYTLQDQWVQGKSNPTEKEAQSWLLRRYLRSFGPATVQDFSKWSGLSIKDTKSVIKSLLNELVEIDMNGEKGFLLEEDLDVIQSIDIQDGLVCLLPTFDNYMLAHRDKSHLIDQKYYKRVYRRAGWLSPVVLVDGRVAGVWSHRLKGKKLLVDVEMFKPMGHEIHDRIEHEASDLGRFMDAEAKIQIRT